MISELIYLVVFIVVVGLVLWLLGYIIDLVPMQEPFKRVAKIALMVIGVLIIVMVLLQFLGVLGPLPRGGTLLR